MDVSAPSAADRDERDAFFRLSSDLLAVLGPDLRMVHLNPAWQQVLGYSLEELKSRPFLDFVHPDDIDTTNRAAVDEMVTLGHDRRAWLAFCAGVEINWSGLRGAEPRRRIALPTYRFAYVARATIPGSFAQPAAFVEDMYAPAITGRSSMGTVNIAAQ